MTKARAGAGNGPSQEGSGRGKYADYNVAAQEFVRVWQTSESLDEVAERLRMPKAIAAARAAGYREKGVPLKKMRRRRTNGLDVAALNEIIEGLAAQAAAAKGPEGPAAGAAPTAARRPVRSDGNATDGAGPTAHDVIAAMNGMK